MRRARPVTARLVGGIGNQLFVYCAGHFLSDSLNSPLELDLTLLDTDRTRHGVSIEDFCNLKGTFVRSGTSPRIMRARHALFTRLHNRFRLIEYLQLHFGSLYTSKVVGYDPNIACFRKPRKIQGYFQTWRFAGSLDYDEVTSLGIKSPTSWFLNLQSIAFKIRPIMVHVRIGDYLQPENSYFGILGENYYLRGISRIRKEGISAPIWLFSDDLEKARELHPRLAAQTEMFIQAPAGSFPGEEMILMSLGSANLIANSTFSWWGAYLNRYSKITVAPAKWFKSAPDPEELIPKSWIRIPSEWVRDPNKEYSA